MILRFLKRYWFFAVLASAFMALEVLVDIYQPRLMARIVDQGILGIGSGGIPDLSLIGQTGIRMIIVVIAGGACGILSGVFTNLCAQNCGNNIRKACFERIMHFSFEQTDRFTAGSLITRMTSDVTQVQNLISQMIRGFVRCIVFFIGGSMALLTLDLSFGVIVAITIPILLFNIIFILWKTNPLFTLVQKRLDTLNTVIRENVSGARVVKAFIQEKRETARFDDANADLVNTQFRVLILLSWLRPVMNIVLNLAIVGIIYIGAGGVREGSIAPGAVMAAITYIAQILSGMMMMAMIFQMLSRGMASSKRLKEVLDTEPAIKEPEIVLAGQAGGQEAAAYPEYAPAAHTGSRVCFHDVSFSYPGFPGEILHDINIEIHPGETFAVIGATASGKSTLIHLIPRFYDVTGGSVTIDGTDVREIPLVSLRDMVSVVLQKSELFSTTIRDNIALGKPEASDAEIEAAAKAAQAHTFIMDQSDQYQTQVAQAGMSLSGGQRQRVAIARALLKPAGILILDDATSALDLKTEEALYEALNDTYAGMTKIIIAQRIASIRHADRIAVLDGGTIIACDTHEVLMDSCEVYREIYDSQLKEKEDISGKEVFA